MSAHATTAVCDFCSAPDPVWLHPAYSFDDLCGARSRGDWVACDECARMIAAGDRLGLARRSIGQSRDALVRKMAGEEWIYAYTLDLHGRFFAAWNGRAIRIAERVPQHGAA
jgi:hypothetical protein